LLAGNVAPGSFRSFGFERWPGYAPARFETLRAAARAAVKWPKKLRLHGSDVDQRMVVGALENVRAAGVGDVVELETRALANFTPKPGWNAWIVSNLPYGERIGRGSDVNALYSTFGRLLRERCGGYHVSLLSGSTALSRALGLDNVECTPLLNGGMECERLCAHIEARAPDPRAR
jgi:23S rRNA G2445 N2-methylase RlmL